ncbi:MAG: MarR family winged helix-turn-helix transcriptional regulator [Candidatus Odinarchaeota archaeon]
MVERRAGFLISKIHQLSGRLLTQKTRKYDLDISPAQGRIIFALWDKEEMSFQDLLFETQLGKSTLSSMVKTLEKAGYLKRKDHPDDDRKKRIQLVKKAPELKKKYQSIAKEIDQIYFEGISEEDIVQFEKTLDKVLENLINASGKSLARENSRISHD